MNARTDAIRQIAQSHPDHQPPATDIDTIFGCDVFSLDILQKRLPKPVFRTLKATIARGERVAQLVVQRVPAVELVEVDELDATERGEGGFGSTGLR